jgi:hypothetical protein
MQVTNKALGNELRLDGVTLDSSLRLALAATIAFPDGSMTATGLSPERNRGRPVFRSRGYPAAARGRRATTYICGGVGSPTHD